MALTDVQVVIDVLHPAPVIGLGRPLILVPGASAGYKEYKKIEHIETDYARGTEAFKVANAILSQRNKPSVVCIATYVRPELPASAPEGASLEEVINKYFDKSWHFALLAESTTEERKLLSDQIELRDYKFAVVQIDTATEATALKLNAHTIIYYHTHDGERLDAAVLGDAANLTVGSITWKFRKELRGITPIDIQPFELEELHDAGINCYVMKAGVPQTSEGLVATGEYIDFYHGRDWIKANMESELQSMLTNNDKVPSNSNGVSLVGGVATSVLMQAGKQGIVDVNDEGEYDFNVITVPFNEGTAEDQSKRVYSGLTFDYKAQGAIHAINVHGSVVSNK